MDRMVIYRGAKASFTLVDFLSLVRRIRSNADAEYAKYKKNTFFFYAENTRVIPLNRDAIAVMF